MSDVFRLLIAAPLRAPAALPAAYLHQAVFYAAHVAAADRQHRVGEGIGQELDQGM